MRVRGSFLSQAGGVAETSAVWSLSSGDLTTVSGAGSYPIPCPEALLTDVAENRTLAVSWAPLTGG